MREFVLALACLVYVSHAWSVQSSQDLANVFLAYNPSVGFKISDPPTIWSTGPDVLMSARPLVPRPDRLLRYHPVIDDLPMMGLGTAEFEDWTAGSNSVIVAYHNAMRLFDTAQNYGTSMQSIRQGLYRVGGGAAEQSFLLCKVDLATKAREHPGERMIRQVFRSIDKLRVRWLDAAVIHWPICLDAPASSYEQRKVRFEAWRALEELVIKGYVDHIGFSNWTPELIDEVLSYARIPPTINQVEFSPVCYQRELLDACTERNIAVVGYSPFGKCWLSRFHSDFVEWGCTDLIVNAEVCGIAKEQGCTPSQVLLRWALQHNVAVIPKSIRPERVRENALSLDDRLQLSPEQMARLNSLRDSRRGVEASIEAHSRIIASPNYRWRPT